MILGDCAVTLNPKPETSSSSTAGGGGEPWESYFLLELEAA